MPVQTRSKARKLKQDAEREQTKEEEHNGNFTPNVTTDSNRKQQKRRTSSRLNQRNLSFDDSQSMLSQNDKKRIADEFRTDLKSYMDSPHNKNPKKRMVVQESPRVDRITMQHGTKQQMEFLVPPKDMDDPIEIRQQIRESLNFDKEVPQQQMTKKRNKNNEEEHPLKDSMLTPPKRSSPYPVWNEDKKAWTPNSPSFDKKRADRVSTMLIMIIICVLIAVFIGVYQKEILEFIEKDLKPFVYSAIDYMQLLIQDSIKSLQTIYDNIIVAVTNSMDHDSNNNGTGADVDADDVGVVVTDQEEETIIEN